MKWGGVPDTWHVVGAQERTGNSSRRADSCPEPLLQLPPDQLGVSDCRAAGILRSHSGSLSQTRSERGEVILESDAGPT